MAAIAGRVMPLMKGAYNSATTYEPLDFVTYNNALWGCIKTTKGNAPAEGAYWKKAIDGEVGDAASLGGETATQWQTKLDSIQTTSKATLSQAGWYRVAEYGEVSDGYAANSCELIIKSRHDNRKNEFHRIHFVAISANMHNFYSIEAKSIGNAFTKIRYTKDSNTNRSYLEVYYSHSVAYNVHFTLNDGTDHYKKWQAITPTLTAETVDGVTVTTTYDIPANASPVTDLDLAKKVNIYPCLSNGGATDQYVILARVLKSRTTDFCRALTLITNFNDIIAQPEIFLVEASYRRRESIMQVRALSGYHDNNGVKFGYYSDDTYVYFGVYSKNYAGARNVIDMGHDIDFEVGLNTVLSTKPDGWTTVEPKVNATTSDLTTALAGYLPKTGGAVEGSLTVGTIDDADNRTLYLFNNARRIMFRVNTDGSFNFYDITHDQNIIRSTPEGINILYGIATDCLALNGGGTVSGVSVHPVTIDSTSDILSTLLRFTHKGSVYGFLGFDGANDPVYADANGNSKTLLHTGNSAPIVKSTTAPSDTSAVWIDTTNKKTKAYIDGAWTVIA